MRSSNEELGSGSKQIELGSYHFICDACEERSIAVNVKDKDGNATGEKRDVPVWTLEVTALAGTTPGQEGKQLRYQDLFADGVCDLAVAMGLTDKVAGRPFTKADLDAMRKAKKEGKRVDFEFDPEEPIGRTFYCDVVKGKPRTGGKHEGESFPELGRKIVSVLDPSVAGDKFPKDAEVMRMLTGGGGGGQQQSQQRETVGAGAGNGAASGNKSRPALD